MGSATSGGRMNPSPFTQPSGHRWPAASTIRLKPSARARFCASEPAPNVSHTRVASTGAPGPPEHPYCQAAIGAPSMLNPCHARASELSRCHPGATMGPEVLPRIPYNPRSGRGSYWCARGDLNPHVLADTGT